MKTRVGLIALVTLACGPSARATDIQPGPAKQASAIITVLVPPTAQVFFDQQPTTQSGAQRLYVTPPLAAGRQFTYDIVARWQDGGKAVERKRKTQVSGGARVRVDFLAPPRAQAQKPTTVVAYKMADNPADEQAFKTRNQEMIEAFKKGDADAIANLWTPDGDYIDELGHRYQGRKQIAESFRKLFAGGKGLELRVHRTSFRIVRPDLAIGDGYYEIVPPDGPATTARYTAVNVKKDGEWYMESVREAEAHAPNRMEKLQDLGWLLGDWGDEAKSGALANMSFSMAQNDNFIVGSFTTTVKEAPVAGANIWIGWDPAEKKIRSWMFDSTGGFSQGVWTADGNKLVSQTNSTLRDGKKVSATHVITRVDDNHMTWQATKRTVDGKETPDGPVVKLRRIEEQ